MAFTIAYFQCVPAGKEQIEAAPDVADSDPLVHLLLGFGQRPLCIPAIKTDVRIGDLNFNHNFVADRFTPVFECVFDERDKKQGGIMAPEVTESAEKSTNPGSRYLSFWRSR